MKYIYTHLGLGDQIICNGLIRELINPNEEYSLFVLSRNLVSVSFMFRDIKNLRILEIQSDGDVVSFIRNNNIGFDSIKIIGFCNFPITGAKDFDDSFYLQHNVSFEKRWSSFKVDRDQNSEKILFGKFGVLEHEYVFIHDDHTREYEIDESYIQNKDLPIIRPVAGLSDNIFDYSYIMEKSKESHFIDSSLRLVFDSLNLRNDNLFYHINLKNGKIKDRFISQSKLNFNII
jgi:hypothetical protein